MDLPSGKLSHNYGKSPFLMEKSTISMAIFNSYFDITRGYVTVVSEHHRKPTWIHSEKQKKTHLLKETLKNPSSIRYHKIKHHKTLGKIRYGSFLSFPTSTSFSDSSCSSPQSISRNTSTSTWGWVFKPDISRYQTSSLSMLHLSSLPIKHSIWLFVYPSNDKMKPARPPFQADS